MDEQVLNLTEEALEAKDLNQQALALLQTGNFDAAQEKLDKAIEIDPMTMDSYKNYGDLYLAKEEYQNAKNMYKKALLIEKAGVVYYLYGNACFLNDEPHEGLEYYNLALSAGFDNDEMLFFMGMAYEHMNDDQMALRYIQKSINKNPSRPDYKVKKVSVLLRLNDFEEAEKTVDDLLLNDPELYEGYHMKTLMLMDTGRMEEAEAFSKSAAERFPEDVDLTFDYTKVLEISGKFDDAIRIMEQAERLEYFGKAKPRFILVRAEIAAEKGELSEAISLCQECISLEKESLPQEDARFMLINLLMTKRDFEEALKQSQDLIDKDNQNPYYYAALYYRAFCCKQLDRKADAEKFYKEAISIYRVATLKDPSIIEAYMYRAMSLKDTEKYDEALEMLDLLEKLNDQIAEVHTIKYDIYKRIGKKDLADAELTKAMEMKPSLKPIYFPDEADAKGE